MIIITMETPHFSFLVTGRDEDHAKETLMDAWSKHASQYDIGRNWINATPDDLEGEFEVRIMESWPGEAYRDNERLL